MKIIQGDTVEAQIKHIDVILNRMSKRAHKTITAVITPFPISGYTDQPVNKIVLRYIFPADGKITIGVAFIESMPTEGIDIYVNLHRGEDVNSTLFFTKKNAILIEPDAEVLVGDRLIVSINPKGQGSVSGIWTSFLWVPKIKDTEVRQYLIDDLERISEENG